MRHAQIKAFYWVALSGGFSRAAERLSLTQPAVSDHIRKLEENYGIQLFNRGGRRVELTEIGRQLFAITERLFEAEGEALELLSRARTLEEGQLNIGADAAVHVLPLISSYRSKHPRIGIRLMSGNTAELLEDLHSFAIDVAVTAERPASEHVLARLLRKDRLIALVRHEQGQNQPVQLPLAEIATMPIILREAGSATRRLLLDELHKRGIKPSISIEIESRESAREAVAQGLGTVVMSVGEVVPDSRLQVLEISDWAIGMEEWLLCLKSRASLHVIRSFFETLPDAGADQAFDSSILP
jgi:aminoethylphosphonate catabolism LysR family transcriptional regulator